MSLQIDKITDETLEEMGLTRAQAEDVADSIWRVLWDVDENGDRWREIQKVTTHYWNTHHQYKVDARAKGEDGGYADMQEQSDGARETRSVQRNIERSAIEWANEVGYRDVYMNGYREMSLNLVEGSFSVVRDDNGNLVFNRPSLKKPEWCGLIDSDIRVSRSKGQLGTNRANVRPGETDQFVKCLQKYARQLQRPSPMYQDFINAVFAYYGID